MSNQKAETKAETKAKHEQTMIDRWILKFGELVMWLYVIAVLISFYEVIMRYFLNAPTVWVHETTIAIVGIAMAYGGIYCSANDEHIRVTLVRDLFPIKIQRALAIFVEVLVFLFSMGGIYAMYYMTSRSLITPDGTFYMQRSGSAMNSVWPTLTKLSILLVFCALFVQTILHLIKKIQIFVKGE